ncbi:MAG: YebC/PmpR family DNA-binding transcriptional regulator [Candidatus Dojkabacteria bacterium]
MSGHSKWAKLKHTKGLVDAKKGAVLSKMSKDIIVAVKVGGSSDPDFNPMLRLAIQKAKDANMTNDRVERAINRGQGGIASDQEKIYENTYEAYGPGGFGILIDSESDNPNRTVADIKTLVNKNGGKMAGEKSISWQFSEIGYIKVEVSKENANQLEEKLLDVDGIEDITRDEEESIIEILVQRELFRDAYSKIGEIAKSLSANITEAKLIMQTKNLIELSDEEIERASEFIEKIEESPEVTNTWTNIN